jgi:CDP-6-deoxy-D-xylo-4-hexulose-3-dehydrase
MKSEEEKRAALHQAVAAYCDAHHDFRFDPAHPLVRLHEPTFGAEEINAALDVLLSTRVTMGPAVKRFEREFCDAFGSPHGVMNNSGSSANLLAVAAMANVAWGPHLRPGDEVIVPALSWSTTVWPLVQHGLVPVIVDVDPRTFNLDPNEVERAIGPRTRAIMPVHVYGNPCDMDALGAICSKRNLLLLEDCCEALGASYRGKPVGTFGAIGTYSFYYSHHITTLEGGICISGDDELAELMRVLRAHGWTREMEHPEAVRAKYSHIDPRFLFINVGYNLRATELQGAMGSVQLPKLKGFVETRRANAQAWQRDLGRWAQHFDLQQETPGGTSSWFGFLLVLKDEARFTIPELSAFLNKGGIETRPIICGNIAAQPAMQLYPHRVAGDLAVSNRVMKRGMSFGNHQAIDDRARDYVSGQIEAFMRSRS